MPSRAKFTPSAGSGSSGGTSSAGSSTRQVPSHLQGYCQHRASESGSARPRRDASRSELTFRTGTGSPCSGRTARRTRRRLPATHGQSCQGRERRRKTLRRTAAAATPPANAAGAIVKAIDASEREVLVQAYGFTHNGIAQALVRAHQRGVRVRVLLDQKSDTSNRYVIGVLSDAQIELREDGKHAIAHDNRNLT
jgi:phosphatidylserine/phosphatidylglycerophosphate/cardiolipin synthase-like enzyme